MTNAEWLVTDLCPVNAFVAEGSALPDPRGYVDGYSVAVGSDPERRIRLEKRTRWVEAPK